MEVQERNHPQQDERNAHNTQRGADYLPTLHTEHEKSCNGKDEPKERQKFAAM